MVPKAIDYLAVAGKRAVRVSANQEAIAHFNRALELLKTTPETPERAELELTLQLALVAPWEGAKGFAAPELGNAVGRARELCEQLGSTRKSAEVLAMLASYYATVPQYRTALELMERVAEMAKAAGDPTLTAVVHYSNIWPLLNVAELEKARECAECMLQIYDPAKYSHWPYLYGYDYGVMALGFGSWVQWILGYPDRALSWNKQSISLARKQGHPFTLAFALLGGCEVHWFLRDLESVNAYTDELIPLAAEKGFVYWEGHGIFYRGERWTLEGRVKEGIAEMRRGLDMMLGTGTGTCLTRLLTRVADACREVGEFEQGLSTVAEAMELVQRFDERYMEVELHRLRGELLLMGNEPEAEAEKCFLEALEVSRRQNAKSWELRAAMSLGRLRVRQGRRDEARALLSGVYNWFAEGFGTPDLRDAKALLEGMGEP
jgi:tetratricopeptide (TPR) repeat protein